MSQHFFKSEHQGRPITVVLGWDRPLQCFFMDIIGTNKDPLDEPHYLYSHLEEARPFTLTLEDFRSCLRQLDIDVPPSMFQEVEKDAKEDVGNRFIAHQPNGELLKL